MFIKLEEFDPMRERDRFLSAVHEGLAEADAGRLLEDDEVERILAEEFGPLGDTP